MNKFIMYFVLVNVIAIVGIHRYSIPTTSRCAKSLLEVEIVFFWGGVSPNNKKCSLIFALSCSSLFCHEVLVGYPVAFTNPREIK
jgi:uncharacterized sodium:solute symporter family permease YidK